MVLQAPTAPMEPQQPGQRLVGPQALARRMLEEEGEQHRRASKIQRLQDEHETSLAQGALLTRDDHYELRPQMTPLYKQAGTSDLYSRRSRRWMPEMTFTEMIGEWSLEHPPFNIYQALLGHRELLHEMAKQLDVEDLVGLYAICKDFNGAVNRQYTATMLGNARTNAPESAKIFHFKCYRSLCVYDPARNINEDIMKREGKKQVRDVPGFKWLRMITFREETIDSIIVELAEAGHRLPSQCSEVMKKIWFMMDIPDCKRRIGLIHNQKYWTNMDLFYANLLFIKLDMRFTDPMDGASRPILRKMMLAQRSLSVLNGVLQRRIMKKPWEMLQMFIEWQVVPIRAPPGGMPQWRIPGLPLNDSSVMGVPKNIMGRLLREDWTNDPQAGFLLRPDELVMREAIRRDLCLEKWYLDMLLWGYIDPDTGKDVWPPSVEKAMAKGAPAPAPSYDRQGAPSLGEISGSDRIGDPKFDLFAATELKRVEAGEGKEVEEDEEAMDPEDVSIDP